MFEQLLLALVGLSRSVEEIQGTPLPSMATDDSYEDYEAALSALAKLLPALDMADLSGGDSGEACHRPWSK